MGEIHQNRGSVAVAHRLAHGAKAALEIRGHRDFEFTQAQFQPNVHPLLARGVVDGANKGTILGSDDCANHFGPHPSQCACNHNGDLSGHRSMNG